MLTSDIGYTNDTALLCHTDRPPPMGEHYSGGDWRAPNGTKVKFTSVTGPGFQMNRDSMVVRLKKRTGTGTGTPPEGIYRCSIKDAVMIRRTVYVGLYNKGGGMLFTGFVRLASPCLFVFQYAQGSHCMVI